ncbi:MAG TPA: PspC domain-containing protein [Steroidobacteraceae bacterium]|jgi:phage shock protein PspC (stress-responsive transcriptional regulator)
MITEPAGILALQYRLKEVSMTLGDELSKLGELHERGKLSDEEFARAKARLLGAEAAHPNEPFVSAVNAFRRSRSDRQIAGVCGGIARATGTESWVWRLIFVLLFLCGGAGLLAYVLLAIFVPSE